MNTDPELLTDVSVDELEALAAGVLVSASQNRLNDLLAGAKEHRLSANEEVELEGILHNVDQLNLLKTRARYTINRLGAKAASS